MTGGCALPKAEPARAPRSGWWCECGEAAEGWSWGARGVEGALRLERMLLPSVGCCAAARAGALGIQLDWEWPPPSLGTYACRGGGSTATPPSPVELGTDTCTRKQRLALPIHLPANGSGGLLCQSACGRKRWLAICRCVSLRARQLSL